MILAGPVCDGSAGNDCQGLGLLILFLLAVLFMFIALVDGLCIFFAVKSYQRKGTPRGRKYAVAAVVVGAVTAGLGIYGFTLLTTFLILPTIVLVPGVAAALTGVWALLQPPASD